MFGDFLRDIQMLFSEFQWECLSFFRRENVEKRIQGFEGLDRLFPDTKTACYAWVFISNHAHFLLRTGAVPISNLMRKLLTGYAVGFNLRHNRSGQLFQNRFKSIVCQEDAYFKELVRYIHLNPIRSGLVRTLEELNQYPYCGHSSIVGRFMRTWQDTEYVLGYFDRNPKRARTAYQNFITAGLGQGHREELTGGGLIRSLGGWSEVKRLRKKDLSHMMSDERILGDSAFVESLLSEAGERYERRYELKHRGYDLDRIAERVAEICQIPKHEIFSKGRQQRKVVARSLLCYWAVQEAGISLRELAKRLEMSSPGVGFSVQRGEAIAKQNGYALIA